MAAKILSLYGIYKDMTMYQISQRMSADRKKDSRTELWDHSTFEGQKDELAKNTSLELGGESRQRISWTSVNKVRLVRQR